MSIFRSAVLVLPVRSCAGEEGRQDRSDRRGRDRPQGSGPVEKDIEPICEVFRLSPAELNGKITSTYEKLIKGGKHGPPIVAGNRPRLLYKLCSRQISRSAPPKDDAAESAGTAREA